MGVFGKSIEFVVKADLDRLINAEVEEGQLIDFKQDVPWSDKDGRKGGSPWDHKTNKLDRSGSNAVLATLISFANAEGGVLVLGMRETDESPPRAAEITPIPGAEALAASLRSCIGSSIDPRLPSFDVRAIEIGADKSGVVLLEAGASSLAPHWVATNRKVTVRRRDESIPMTMTEIHRMVLANAQRHDKLEADLDSAASEFENRFFDAVKGFCSAKVIGPDPRTAMRAWVNHEKIGIAGISAMIMPSENMGLSSLEIFPVDKLRRAYLSTWGACVPETWRISYPIGNSTPFAGGVESYSSSSTQRRCWRARRDGFVEIISIAKMPTDRLIVPVRTVVDCIAAALSVFEHLATRAGLSAPRGRIAVEVRTLGRLASCVVSADGLREETGGPLKEKVTLDRRDVGGGVSLAAVIDPIVADLVNAAGMHRNVLPHYGIGPVD